MTWTRAEAEEAEWMDYHCWEEEMICGAGHRWVSLICPGAGPLEPDCEVCERRGERVSVAGVSSDR